MKRRDALAATGAALTAALGSLAFPVPAVAKPAASSSRIEQMAATWRRLYLSDFTGDEGPNGEPGPQFTAYRAIIDAIVAEKPTNPRDVALQYLIDGDMRDSDNSDGFAAAMLELADVDNLPPEQGVSVQPADGDNLAACTGEPAHSEGAGCRVEGRGSGGVIMRTVHPADDIAEAELSDPDLVQFALLLANASPELRAELIAELRRVCEQAGVKWPSPEGAR